MRLILKNYVGLKNIITVFGVIMKTLQNTNFITGLGSINLDDVKISGFKQFWIYNTFCIFEG